MAADAAVLWNKLPIELKRMVGSHCDLTTFCNLRSIDVQTSYDLDDEFTKLFRHLSVLLEPHSLQALFDISRSKHLSRHVKSIPVVMTGGYFDICGTRIVAGSKCPNQAFKPVNRGGKRWEALQEILDMRKRAHKILLEHKELIMEGTFVPMLSQAMANLDSFDSLGFVDGGVPSEISASKVSLSHGGFGSSGIESNRLVLGLGYRAMYPRLKQMIAPWQWDLSTYFCPDERMFAIQVGGVLTAMQDSGKALIALRGYPFASPLPELSHGGTSISNPLATAILNWHGGPYARPSNTQHLFSKISSLSLHFAGDERLSHAQTYFGPWLSKLSALKHLRLDLKGKNVGQVLCSIGLYVEVTNLHTLVLGFEQEYMQGERKCDARKFADFLGKSKDTLSQMVLIGHWYSYFEHPEKLLLYMLNNLSLATFATHFEVQEISEDDEEARYESSALTTQYYAVDVLHNDEDSQALDVKWRYEAVVGTWESFEAHGAAEIKPLLARLAATYPAWTEEHISGMLFEHEDGGEDDTEDDDESEVSVW